MTDQPGNEPAGDAPPPAPALPPSAPPPAPNRAAVPAAPVAPAPAPSPTPGGWGAPPHPGPAAVPAAPTAWSTAPVGPPKPAGPRNTSSRTAIGVILIIVAVLFGANLVNAALPLPEDPATVDPGPGIPAEPTAQPQPGEPTAEPQPGESLTPIRTLPPLEPGPVEAGDPIDVGAGFVLTPPAGWTVVGGEDGLTVLQKGNVLVIVGGFPWADTATALAEAYRDAWFAGGEFTGDDPSTGEIGNGIPASVIGYTGVAQGQTIDGAIVAGAVDGQGLVFNAFGESGSLAGVSDDLDQMLATLGHTGG